jgi:PAS domain S-box-containing protein
MIVQFGKKKDDPKDGEQNHYLQVDYLNNLFQKTHVDEKTLAVWLQDIVDEFKGDEGAIFVMNANDLLCEIAVGTTSLIEGRKILPNKGLPGWLLESKKPAFLSDTYKDIRFDSKNNIFNPIPKSIVASPILFRNKVYGIIQINRRKARNPFESVDAEKLLEIAKIFGIYLHLLEYEKREKERLTKKKETRLEEQLTFETATQTVPIGFFLINEDLRILFINDFALKTLGTKKEETVGKRCRDIIISHDKKGEKLLLDEFLSTFPAKHFFQSPLHLLRNDGHEITVAFGISPFDFAEKKFAVIYFTNPAEWEMVYSKEDQFITNVAHELRTPLFAILGSLSILETELKRSKNLPPTIKSFLNIVKEEGEKFTNILNALLDFDEVSKWNIGLKREPILILDLVKSIADDFKSKCHDMSISLEVDFPSDPIQISGDELALQYAFSHLIDNAIKFNRKGGNIIIATEGLILRESSWNFEITIKDTGIGIPQSELPYIFGKFYRVEKEIHTISGFGLGLTIVKDIIEMHGGNILVESEMGKGTTFTVQLPTMEI